MGLKYKKSEIGNWGLGYFLYI